MAAAEVPSCSAPLATVLKSLLRLCAQGTQDTNEELSIYSSCRCRCWGSAIYNTAPQQACCSGGNAPPLCTVAMVVAPVQSVLCLCAQGTEDLEEVLSERLQQLPPPLSVHGGGASPIREEGGQGVQPGDELPAEPSKARPVPTLP